MKENLKKNKLYAFQLRAKRHDGMQNDMMGDMGTKHIYDTCHLYWSFEPIMVIMI
jgi:hypothetical protein